MKSIAVLYFDGCPNAIAAFELAKSIAAKERILVDVSLSKVSGATEATEMRFFGSPTIQVDGVDVEVARRGSQPFSFSCRLYETGNGISGLPPAEWIASALKE